MINFNPVVILIERPGEPVLAFTGQNPMGAGWFLQQWMLAERRRAIGFSWLSEPEAGSGSMAMLDYEGGTWELVNGPADVAFATDDYTAAVNSFVAAAIRYACYSLGSRADQMPPVAF